MEKSTIATGILGLALLTGAGCGQQKEPAKISINLENSKIALLDSFFYEYDNETRKYGPLSHEEGKKSFNIGEPSERRSKEPIYFFRFQETF